MFLEIEILKKSYAKHQANDDFQEDRVKDEVHSLTKYASWAAYLQEFMNISMFDILHVWKECVNLA